GLAQQAVPPQTKGHEFHCASRFYRVLEERDGLGEPPRVGIRQAKVCGDEGEQAADVRGLAELQTMFEQTNGFLQVATPEVEIPDARIGEDPAEWVLERFGDPDPVFSVSDPVGELSQLG